MSDYTAGGSEKLGIVRYGRDLMEQHEGPAASNIYPGEAITGDGAGGFDHHDGTSDAEVYVAVEARGRGMDAQDADGYPVDDEVIAVRAAGGGLNLLVTAGENVAEDDALVVDDANPGQFRVYDGAGGDTAADVVAYAAEDADLSGNADPELVGADME